uniref:Uncharacterized protein n=1 Tax=blood disease bacterium R229 TaxID=741978 RepID=G2ZVV9_9RALS|nr:hypothetical protein BDB_mp60406 [blood disease bacterium R229]
MEVARVVLSGTLEAIFTEFVVLRYFKESVPVSSAALPLLTRYVVLEQKVVKRQHEHFIPLYPASCPTC